MLPNKIKNGSELVFPAGYKIGTELHEIEVRIRKSIIRYSVPGFIDLIII
jgi:hypothetical protein